MTTTAVYTMLLCLLFKKDCTGLKLWGKKVEDFHEVKIFKYSKNGNGYTVWSRKIVKLYLLKRIEMDFHIFILYTFTMEVRKGGGHIKTRLLNGFKPLYSCL